MLNFLAQLFGIRIEPKFSPEEMSRLCRMRAHSSRHDSHGRRKDDLVSRVRTGSVHTYYTPPTPVHSDGAASVMEEIAKMRGFLASRLYQTSYQPMIASAYRDIGGRRGF